MIFVIIPVHNRVEHTRRCIASLFAQLDVELSVFVVDDGSTDGTAGALGVEFPNVTIIAGDGNLFWTGAVAIGISTALGFSKAGDWIILLNNDVQFVDRHTISRLVMTGRLLMRRALVLPVTIDEVTKAPVTTGSVVKSWALNWTCHLPRSHRLESVVGSVVDVDLVTARCLLHPVEAFDRIGNYDNAHFPHYGGDDEFSVRAKSAGYRLVIDLREVVALTRDAPRAGVVRSVRDLLFDKRSSINIVDRLRFASLCVPWYARPSYALIGILKSIYLSLKK